MRRNTLVFFVVCSLLCPVVTVMAEDTETVSPDLRNVEKTAALSGVESAAPPTAPSKTWAGLWVRREFLALIPEAPAAGVSAFPPAAPPPPSGVRKAPLIIGIAGAAVMVVGIVVAASDDGFVGVHAAGVTTAIVGGAVAATGFYFAFRR